MLGSASQAQQFDLTVGVSTVTGPASAPPLQTVSGGAYPNFGLDCLFFKI